MAFNLSRSTKLYLSTLGPNATTGFSPSNTFEVRVLTGYDFTQSTSSQTITLNEAGDTPVRGQKVFNTAIDPADVTITTYIRPYLDTINHTAIERILWEALVGMGNKAALATAPFSNTTADSTSFRVDFENSDVHELLLLQAYFELDNTTYQIKDLTLDSAEVDFSIDGIAKITWKGKGSDIIEDTPARANVANWTAGTNYLAAPNANFIKNKLSTLTLTDNAGLVVANQTVSLSPTISGSMINEFDGTSTYTATITVDGTANNISIPSATTIGLPISDIVILVNDQLDGANLIQNDVGNFVVTSLTHGANGSISIVDGTTPLFTSLITASTATVGTAVAGSGTGKTYVIPITGGNLMVANNISFLTPEELGTVNRPIGSFTGARSISGSVTAYLRTGTTSSAQLLADLVAATNVITQDFTVTIAAGGAANTPRAVFTLNHAHLVIPSIKVADVISTDISFTGLGQDISQKDELNIEYIAQ